MQIPLINTYKDDDESPFDTCLEKGHICLYTMEKDWQVEPWKYWLKKINHSNSTLLEYFHSAIEQEVWKTLDKICSFIMTSSTSISGSRLDDITICNTANQNYTKKITSSIPSLPFPLHLSHMSNFSIHNSGFFLAQSDMLPNTNLMHVHTCLSVIK